MNHEETAPDLETFLENAGEQSKKRIQGTLPHPTGIRMSKYAGHEPGRRWPP